MPRVLLFTALTVLLAACGGTAADSPVTPMAYGEIAGSEEKAMPIPGRPAPDFAFGIEIEGAERLSGLRGRVVLLNFWATWCPYCVKEIPALDAVYRRYRDRGLVVIGIDVGETPAQVAEFRERVPFTYPLVYDRDQSIFRSYWGRVLPVTFVIDRKGTVIAILMGETTEQTFTDAVLPLLDG